MRLIERAKRLAASPTELDAERLRCRCGAAGLTPINEVECRRPARIAGEVQRMTVAPRSGVPALRVVVSDGTTSAVAVFTGRREIVGIEHGRLLILEGVPREEHGHRVWLNPAYTLLSG